jgi:hypothetical protein
MAAHALALRLDQQAEFALSTLSEDDRRIVEGWFGRIRNWHTDDDVRSRSRRLEPDDGLYAFQADGSNLIIAFRIDGDEATILSILNSQWLRYFQPEGSAT